MAIAVLVCLLPEAILIEQIWATVMGDGQLDHLQIVSFGTQYHSRRGEALNNRGQDVAFRNMLHVEDLRRLRRKSST